MTITLVPDPNPRRVDLARKHKPHVGPYYGRALRKIVNAEPPESARERHAEAVWLTALAVVFIAILLATFIVSL